LLLQALHLDVIDGALEAAVLLVVVGVAGAADLAGATANSPASSAPSGGAMCLSGRDMSACISPDREPGQDSVNITMPRHISSEVPSPHTT
jgi:hypothetical protein